MILGIKHLFNFSELTKRPLVGGFLLFATGIIYAHYINIGFHAFLYLAAFLVLAFFFLRKKSGNIPLILLSMMIFISGALSFIHFNAFSGDNIYNLLKLPQQQAYIRGTVKSLPAYTWQRWGNRRCSFILDVSAHKDDTEWFGAGGLSQVTIVDNDREYSYGDSILIYGNIKKLMQANSTNPGYIRYLNRRGIHTSIEVKNDEDITLIGRAGPLSFKKHIHNLRRRAERRFKRYLPYPDDAVLSAMLIGRREHIPKGLANIFINTGTIHILSVSGLHVGIISGIIFFCLRLFNIPKRPVSIITILFLWFYVVMAGERTPVIRASIMISIYLLSIILERDFDLYSVLSFAGFLILLFNPAQVFDAGFQLSFSCVFFIVFLTPRIEGLFLRGQSKPKKSPQKGYIADFLFYLRKGFISSLAVFVGVWPIVAFHFSIISPVTVIANMVVIPFLGIILSLGGLFALIPDMLMFLTKFLANVIHVLFFTLFNIADVLSILPFASFKIECFPLWLLFAYYLALYIVCQGLLPYNIHAKGRKDF